MSNQVTIGGERLGSGKKMKATLKGYERSNHDLSHVFRSTMACGTLVPFLHEVALPGDTHDIELHLDVLTHPTIGPLFGSYKVQLDLFQVPIRLYQGKLHMNMLNIGMDMSKVPLPQMLIKGAAVVDDGGVTPVDNQQINPSSIFAYLGVRGLAGIAYSAIGEKLEEMQRYFNAIPWLAYWDIYKQYYANKQEGQGYVLHTPADIPPYTPLQISSFDLSGVDDMRIELLKHFDDTPYIISDATNIEPYKFALQNTSVGGNKYSCTFSQEGLALKTYNSDLFNNWIETEFIDGTEGISAVTAIDTSGGSFTIDELNLSKKVYEMLNRIAISGGTYNDWLETVYDHKRVHSAENPMYLGGLMQELVFQEVVSNAATADQPLGTLAGRGRLSDSRKGGKIVAKIDEPSYIIGIASITPRLDYTTGNQWDMNLKSMNDLHKPALDEIGFQDLITDQMAWWDTQITDGNVEYKSAGKQPAWINYMTKVNVALGNFADELQQQWMVLARRYGVTFTTSQDIPHISDVTTYIDPSKFNNIFADTSLDAQNFWVQIGMQYECRRKMSAKIMPNL